MNSKVKKVIGWRACSISVTLLVTWLYTGSVKDATLFTMFLHAILMISHYLFEVWWDKNETR